MNNLKIISWNIAGGYPTASLKHFDYEPENIGYFAEQIKHISPDIVCLQESHTSLDGKRSIAHELGIMLNMPFILNSPASPSHINSAYQLGTAIISKNEFINSKVHWYPDPQMELFFTDGRKAITHRKNLQTIKIGDYYIANHQLLPISLFGYKYNDGSNGSKFAKQIDLTMKIIATPIIWCGDFNFNNPKSIYTTIQELELSEALPDEPTRPTDGSKKTPDHIYYSKEFSLIQSGIIKTKSDHYLCYAEFSYN